MTGATRGRPIRIGPVTPWRDVAVEGHLVDVDLWVPFEVWSHKIAWGGRVGSLQEPLCPVAWVKVWEEEEELPEKDKESQESGWGWEPGERWLDVAELWSRTSLETCREVGSSGTGVGG